MTIRDWLYEIQEAVLDRWYNFRWILAGRPPEPEPEPLLTPDIITRETLTILENNLRNHANIPPTGGA